MTGRVKLHLLGALALALVIVAMAPVASASHRHAYLGPGTGSSPEQLTVSGGQVFFVATEMGQLWRTDGSRDGTRLVKDIHPGGSPRVWNPTDIAGKLYFFADDGKGLPYGLWRSDGTEGGTTLIRRVGGSVGNLTNLPARLCSATGVSCGGQTEHRRERLPTSTSETTVSGTS